MKTMFRLSNLTKHFDRTVALEDVSLDGQPQRPLAPATHAVLVGGR